MFLLDTNTCIHLLRQSHDGVQARFLSHAPAELAVCSIVLSELEFGARRSRRVDHNLRLLKAFSAPLRSLPFDDRCAETYGLLRADLAAQGQLIGPNDLLIAAIARTHDATLVTHNVSEFGRVVGLRVDDWE